MDSRKIRNKDLSRWEWRNKDGKLHRTNGPAIEYDNGDKSWWYNGYWHREDGPAAELNNGDKFWYKNGKRHREDGPAAEYDDGAIGYYLDNIKYSHYDWLLKIRTKKLEDLLNGK